MRMLNEDATAAANHVIAELADLGGMGGAMVVAPDGTAIFSFNTPGMYRGKATSKGEKYIAIYGDE
jgi:beta-aspartyl-peptidase (threonine type)